VRDPASGEGVERIDAAPRGFFEIGRRNLWGKNRSVSLFTRAGLRRRGGSALAEEPGRSGFIEYRVIGTYREPRLLGTGADAQVSAFAEQGVRSSFNFRRIGVNTELARRLTPSVTVTARHAFGDTRLFDERFNPAEKPVIDRLFPQVRPGATFWACRATWPDSGSDRRSATSRASPKGSCTGACRARGSSSPAACASGWPRAFRARSRSSVLTAGRRSTG
jgi:hypothetical protein